MPKPDEETLELLRRQSGLSIDLEGHLCHRGEPITHERTLAVLWSSLHRQADGRYLVRVGRESGYVEVQDAPYAVRGLTREAERLTLHLTDGTEESLDPTTLSVDRDGVLHARVKGGEHRARFSRSAQVDLGLLLEEVPPGTGRFVLRLGMQTFPVRALA